MDGFQSNHGRQSLAALSDAFPEVCDEIHGLTDGLNCPYEKFASWLLCMGGCLDPKGCTAFCFKQCDGAFYGRNNDLPPFLRGASKSIL